MNGGLSSVWCCWRIASTAPNLSTAWRCASAVAHASAEIVRRLLREMFLHLFAQTLISEVLETCEKRRRGALWPQDWTSAWPATQGKMQSPYSKRTKFYSLDAAAHDSLLT
jgi:hypothetical protein